jgi:diguanylate cyclase (GGDEF)-like protein
MYSQYDSRISIYEDSLKEAMQRSLESASNSFDLLNNSYHNQNEDRIAYIIKDASGASVKFRDKIRYNLRKEFTSLFNDRKLAYMKSFQIFDKYGNSIIRFHKLDRYDDNIIKKRNSIKKVSTDFVAQQGFEIGEYVLTYRYQYPLFYDGEFIGSYEFGVDFHAFDKEMQKLFSIKNILFLHKKDITKTLNKKSLDKNYQKIDISDSPFYMLKTKTKPEAFNISQKIIHILESSNDWKAHEVNFINFKYDGISYIAITTPIKNINNKHIGFILTYKKDNTTMSIFRTFIEELIIAFLLGIMLLIVMYKELKYREYIRNIIDINHDILIVTDGNYIYDANKTFLTFFNYENLKAFQKDYSCICDLFISEDGFIQKDMNGVSWFKYIIKNDQIEKMVIMNDKNNTKRYFKVIVEGFSHSKNYIIVFSDLTEELLNRKELENKAYYDTLTNIYSRERFDFYLDEKLKQQRSFSLIMFDIDHFKDVNDKYGHDVGDSVLKEITQLVSMHIRKDDIFARWGGEEFMIIVNTNVIESERFANKLRKIIELHQFTYVKKLTCSFGIVKYRKNEQFKSITKRVDTMLYSAKESGRNCVVMVN